MVVAREEMLKLVESMPESFDLEDLQYCLYLRQKLEAAEEDIREGRYLTHEDVVRETATWFKE